MKWWSPRVLIVTILLVLGLIVRLYRINSPIADWHSHRQADTASVTKIFLTDGLDLLHPRYHDLSDVQSGKENPSGYRMVEFPIYNLLSFVVVKSTNLDIVTASRLTSIILSLGSALFIYLISQKLTRSFAPSIAAMAVFLFLPFNIFYSRVILPEPAAVFFMLSSLYFFLKNQSIAAGVFLGLSILIKPYTAIILFPTLLLLSYYQWNKTPSRLPLLIKYFLFAAISIFPFILWRSWIAQFPEGIPRSGWLLNNGNTTTFPVWFHGYNLEFLNRLIAFRPHWFKWLFFERISNLILGGFGLIPLFLGFVYRKNRVSTFTASLLAGIVLYFVIIAQGNIQHDYYQSLIIPSLSIITGFGIYYIYNFTFESRLASILSLSVIMIFAAYFSYSAVKGYYVINRPEIISAGSKARELLPSNSLIVAPYQGDTAFLYQTGFRGWPTEAYDIEGIRSRHPHNPLYLISVNYDDYTNSMMKNYPTLFKTGEFIILDINK